MKLLELQVDHLTWRDKQIRTGFVLHNTRQIWNKSIGLIRAVFYSYKCKQSKKSLLSSFPM